MLITNVNVIKNLGLFMKRCLRLEQNPVKIRLSSIIRIFVFIINMNCCIDRTFRP